MKIVFGFLYEAFSYWQLVIYMRLLAVGYWFLVFGYWWLVYSGWVQGQTKN